MSYRYTVSPDVVITRVREFCWAHATRVSVDEVVRVLGEWYGCYAEPVWSAGAQAVQIISGPRASEHEGVQGVKKKWGPLLEWVEPYEYTITDERGNTITMEGEQ